MNRRDWIWTLLSSATFLVIPSFFRKGFLNSEALNAQNFNVFLKTLKTTQMPVVLECVVQAQEYQSKNEEAAIWEKTALITALNEAYIKKGFITDSEFHYDGSKIYRTYRFPDVESYQNWVREISSKQLFSLQTEDHFSVKQDISGNEYVHALSISLTHG